MSIAVRHDSRASIKVFEKQVQLAILGPTRVGDNREGRCVWDREKKLGSSDARHPSTQTSQDLSEIQRCLIPELGVY
jgi:hypothetical protein